MNSLLNNLVIDTSDLRDIDGISAVKCLKIY